MEWKLDFNNSTYFNETTGVNKILKLFDNNMWAEVTDLARDKM